MKVIQRFKTIAAYRTGENEQGQRLVLPTADTLKARIEQRPFKQIEPHAMVSIGFVPPAGPECAELVLNEGHATILCIKEQFKQITNQQLDEMLADEYQTIHRAGRTVERKEKNALREAMIGKVKPSLPINAKLHLILLCHATNRVYLHSPGKSDVILRVLRDTLADDAPVLVNLFDREKTKQHLQRAAHGAALPAPFVLGHSVVATSADASVRFDNVDLRSDVVKQEIETLTVQQLEITTENNHRSFKLTEKGVLKSVALAFEDSEAGEDTRHAMLASAHLFLGEMAIFEPLFHIISMDEPKAA